ncbi:MAG: transaldolase [Actinobacteria bacterium]|nr:transaldolase [Actinomycetota bacterium]
MSNSLSQISKAGVSVWLDDLSRARLSNGSLTKLIAEDCVVGVTTNPSIFNAAIGNSDLYAPDIQRLKQLEIDQIITELTCADVSAACDLFMPTYEASKHKDGRISIEVDPRFARDTKSTVAQGISLWEKINKPNLMIKVPATLEGLPAITQLIASGISVNVTLIFSVARYRQVLDAYMAGLRSAKANGIELNSIFSVASFFISRIDTEVDKTLAADSELKGTAAIANAIMAYQAFTDFNMHSEWQELEKAGANKQRPLWASTGVKDPAYDPTRYVMQLVAIDTVNTMPEVTLKAVRESGVFTGDTITSNFLSAKATLARLALAGVDLEKITNHLEKDGVAKFESAWLELIDSVKNLTGK